MGLYFLAILIRANFQHAHTPQAGGGFKAFALAAGSFALWRLESYKSARLQRSTPREVWGASFERCVAGTAWSGDANGHIRVAVGSKHSWLAAGRLTG